MATETHEGPAAIHKMMQSGLIHHLLRYQAARFTSGSLAQLCAS